MTDQDAMNNQDAQERMDQQHAGEHEAGQLTKQTPGLDGDVTSAIAGPDWDPGLVDEARDEVGGTELEGEVQTGDDGDR